ncbi:FRIGIDA-like protein 3 isoform X1 [Arachis duranensis]|uniref:FRIGIDA-like protein n=1 Tax=Arachis duranensis TaxID=130453 RepID=A0A6P4BAK7_ARADU|nr:FRIGIDA-like protein 3 isoform X1 [Arachis duranensis]
MGKKKLLESRCSPCYINDMMRHLEKTHSDAKLAEIEAIGFGFLRHIPKWPVKQDIMVALARSYNLDRNTLQLDAANISINADLIGRVFGLPSGGDDFPSFNDKNAAHVAVKNQFHRRTQTELRKFIYECSMESEADRMEFRRHFILVVLKMFLCPTTQPAISAWHIPPILDVSNPRRFIWPMKIFNWLKQAIKKYQLKKNKTCEGCMFALLVLYFQRLKHGQLEHCQEPEPWISAWTAEELEKKAINVLDEFQTRPKRERLSFFQIRKRSLGDSDDDYPVSTGMEESDSNDNIPLSSRIALNSSLATSISKNDSSVQKVLPEPQKRNMLDCDHDDDIPVSTKMCSSQNYVQQAKKLKMSENASKHNLLPSLKEEETSITHLKGKEILSGQYSEECQKKREAANQKFHLLEKDIEELSKKLECKKKQFDSIHGQLSSYSSNVEVKKKEYERLQRGIEGQIKELESKEKRFSARMEDIELKERQIDERMMKLYSKEKQFEGQLEEVESIRKKYESKLKKILFKQKQVEAQSKELEAKMMQHEASVKSFKEQKQEVANYTDNQSSTDKGSFRLFSSEPNDRDILDVLQSFSDPAKVTLDIIKDPIDSHCKKVDQAMAIDDSHIFLLEQLMKISPDIASHVREEAMELALHMKANMRLSIDNSLVVLSFLMILSIYKLVSSFDEDEVLKLFEIVAHHKPAIEVFQMIGFADKISDFVENLIKNEQYIEAVRFICAYDLAEKNLAADLFRKHVNKAKLTCESSCKEPKSIKIKAAKQEITSLKTVLQCISENNQECEDLVKEIQDRILEVEKLKRMIVTTSIKKNLQYLL